ncbi:hypothetical protein ISS37_07400 [candidate division KSB1 bacterium]|nr:hypothetical protein [candidate division KSB1 bacterium]
MAIYEDVKKALQELIVPEIRTLQVEMKRLDENLRVEMKRLDEKIDSFRHEFASEIKRVDHSISSLEERLGMVLEIRERLAAL